MTFPNEYYKDILDRIIEKVPTASNFQIVAWKSQIKKLFMEGFLIKEILSALPIAFQRSKWNQPLFKRIKQLILEQRRDAEHKPRFKENKVESLSDIFQHYQL